MNKFIYKKNISLMNEMPSNIVSSSNLKNHLKFEDFTVITQISNGSFGDVFLAKNLTTGNKLYAIKTIHLRPKDSDEDVLKEIEALEKIQENELRPQAIPHYYGYSKETNRFLQTQYHIIFEYFPQNLKSFIRNLKEQKEPAPLSFDKIKKYFNSLINGLAFLQAMDVCHRDLKPDNLLLSEDLEQIYIIDYGVSQGLMEGDSDPNLSKKKMDIAGSPMYFSPELIEDFNNNKNHSVLNPFKSDVFSFALIFLELATLKLPKKHTNFAKNWKKKSIESSLDYFQYIYEEILEEKPQKRELEKMVGILRKCLDFDPDSRPDFIGLFKKNLKKIKDVEKLKLHILVVDEQIKLNKSKMNESTIVLSSSFFFYKV